MDQIQQVLQDLQLDYKSRYSTSFIHEFIHEFNKYELRISKCYLGSDYCVELFYDNLCVFISYLYSEDLANYVKIINTIIHFNLHEKYELKFNVRENIIMFNNPTNLLHIRIEDQRIIVRHNKGYNIILFNQIKEFIKVIKQFI